MFTIGNIICLVVLIGFSIFFAIAGWAMAESIKGGLITFVVCLCITLIVMASIGWYNTNTASGKRALKDNQSELTNGIDREITITAEDGREIFHYEGKVDVESDHTDNYIKFESEEGKRYLIYYGIQDTITIIEK